MHSLRLTYEHRNSILNMEKLIYHEKSNHYKINKMPSENPI
jgi:hypothetical protein